ncbi:MAG TPA: sulfite reductase subunit alpha [Rhodocyclaceae bacterium]|nr:sulfite reductase subunit alpha [Rhodocyclaceae bacterium]
MLPTELLLDPALRLGSAAGLTALYGAVCGGVLWREGSKRKAKAALGRAAEGSPAWLVVYASQTGTAEDIAVATGRQLHQAGLAVQVLALNALSLAQLQQAECALFVASTCGEGDAPDNGALFAMQQMTKRVALAQLHFAVLALGDDSYAQHCAFGRALDHWLRECGAQALRPCIEVNRGDSNALGEWQALLTHQAGSSDAPDWHAPAFETWRLVARACLNPGSQGEPLYEVSLLPMEGALPHWESGDLAQVRMAADDDRPREYSIASLPAEGCLRLLVRLHRDAQGGVGLSSGWFAAAEIDSQVQLRVRPHRLFRLGENARRPLILIGNGSGLAGLRGHIKARELAGQHDNWLIYGERNEAHDAIWAAELEAWREAQCLRRLDRVFSRDAQAQRYVQDVLRNSRETLQHWVARGAAIYVCGSRRGMAADVDAALSAVLGEQGVASLALAGRYRRDVY